MLAKRFTIHIALVEKGDSRRINSINLLKLALLTIEQLVIPAVAAQILTVHGPIQMSYKTGMSLK